MSAIAGIVRPGGGTSTGPIIRAMTAALPAPASAKAAFWHAEDAAFGHRPLHATAQSLEAEQPLQCGDGAAVVVLDGYLTNHRELRSALEQTGAHPRSGADAELVLQAYRVWGQDCTRRIDGEFAFAIWDNARRELFCARDHQGLRPFYYHCDGEQFVFGSSIAAVLAALQSDPRPNPGFMAEIMSDRWYTVDETVWMEVQRLPPAHSLRLANGRIALEQYWTLATEPTLHYRRDEEYFEHYREVFADCVRRAARTHLPLAIEVSGGLDSSAVFTMADALLQTGELGAPELRGYTMQGAKGSRTDERGFVDAVARKTGRAITTVPLALPSLEWFTRQARDGRDIPTYPNGAISLNLDRQLVADGCRVKLTGIGGDQWLDGSRRYYHEAFRRGDLAALSTSMRADLRDLGAARTVPLLLRALARPLVPARLRAMLRPRNGDDRAEGSVDSYWLCPDLRRELDQRKSAYLASLPGRDRDRYKQQKMAFPYLMLGLELTARQYADVGCEARHPFLSRQFIEFCAAIPERMRLRGSTRRFVHRQALADLLPREVAERTSKAEFSVSFEKHIPTVASFCLEAQASRYVELIDKAGLARLINACRNAPIDEAPYWELWGNYAIAALFLHEDSNGRE